MTTSLVEERLSHPEVRKFLTRDRYLRRRFSGTVCFSTGEEVGCGANLSLHKNDEITLKYDLSAYGIEQPVAKRLEINEPWSYTSGKCELCNPEICYPNCTIDIFESFPRFDWWRSSNIETVFLPGNVGYSIEKNCIQDHIRCNCTKEQHSQNSSQSDGSRYYPDSSYSVVVTPISFQRDKGFNSSSPTGDVMGSIVSDTETLIDHDISRGTTPGIGILDPSHYINWVYPKRETHEVRISLISRNYSDFYGIGNSTFSLDEQYFPVLAVTQSTPESMAEISLTITKSGNDIHKYVSERKNEKTATGLFTVIWNEFDLKSAGPSIKLENGMEARLQIKLINKDRYIVGILNEKYLLRGRE